MHLERLNPKTNTVENLEILFFIKRMEQTSEWKIPVLAELRLEAQELEGIRLRLAQ